MKERVKPYPADNFRPENVCFLCLLTSLEFYLESYFPCNVWCHKSSFFINHVFLHQIRRHWLAPLKTLDRDFIFVFSGPMEFRWLFPILKKKIQPNFFFEDWDFHSFSTHTSYMVTFFNLMAIVCVIANLFFYWPIVHYNKFPNLGVFHATFPNLKGPRATSQNWKKNPCLNTY